jgi:ATP-dependent DNA ligase
VLRHACKLRAEGIVSKRLGSRYRSGRSPDWLKFKNPKPNDNAQSLSLTFPTAVDSSRIKRSNFPPKLARPAGSVADPDELSVKCRTDPKQV